MAAEERVVNERTGGEKGRKEDRYDLLPYDVLEQDALLYGIGSRKYAERNWEKGYAYSLSLRAIMSHLVAWVGGESWDKEGFHHLAALRFHAAALMRFERDYPELDDVRPAAQTVREEPPQPKKAASALPPRVVGTLEERLREAKKRASRGKDDSVALTPEEWLAMVMARRAPNIPQREGFDI